MNGLTQIKGNDGILYDVNWDEDFGTFIIWEHEKEEFKGIPISALEMKCFIDTNQVEVVKDGNNVIARNIV